MRKSSFALERIIAILAGQERGATDDVCRKPGLSAATFYKFKAKYGEMDLDEVRKLKLLAVENGRLKRMLADAMLDNTVLKDLLRKN